jgi:hypothetical protein
VRWHTPLAVVLGLLLPMPLLLVLGSALDWGAGVRTLDAQAVSPVLSWAEGRRLATFGRPCHKREDCEPPLACLQDRRRVIEPRCAASECTTNMQCQDGFVCQAVDSLGEGPRVRICIAEGVALEGASCDPFPRSRDEACAPGLLCQGWCGRPCQLGAPASCPQGTFCKEGLNGPSCVPSCEGKSCPEGQRCVRFSEGISACASVKGNDCQHNSCPESQQCRVGYEPSQKDQVTMECVRPCGERHPCLPGTRCYYGTCRQPCGPDASDACEPGQRCIYNPVDKLWVCSP